jgi:hypothetical protein
MEAIVMPKNIRIKRTLDEMVLKPSSQVTNEEIGYLLSDEVLEHHESLTNEHLDLVMTHYHNKEKELLQKRNFENLSDYYSHAYAWSCKIRNFMKKHGDEFESQILLAYFKSKHDLLDMYFRQNCDELMEKIVKRKRELKAQNERMKVLGKEQDITSLEVKDLILQGYNRGVAQMIYHQLEGIEKVKRINPKLLHAGTRTDLDRSTENYHRSIKILFSQ